MSRKRKAKPEHRLKDALAVFFHHAIDPPPATDAEDQDAFLKQAQEKASQQNPHNVGMR